MPTQFQELNRLSISLVTVGGLLLLLGNAAVVWPDDVLIPAMLATGSLAGLVGVYEMSIGLRARRSSRARLLSQVHGLSLIGFAILTLGFLRVALRTAMLLVAAWLVLYCMLMIALTLALWPMRRTRWVLFTWTIANVVLACAAVAYSGAMTFALLYFGAVYAAVFGAFEIAAGVWMRRIALPRVGPTAQSGWLTPHA